MTELSQLDVTTKAAVLLEALPYIQRFRDAVFVVKYGGAFMDDADPAVRTRVATDIAFLSAAGIKVVVVHGGGKAISRALAASKVDTHFKQGLRVSDAASMQVIEQTLNHEVNLEICEILQAKSARPLGIYGNQILVCDKKEVQVNGESLDLGFVGETHTVKTKIIKKALNDGYIPIISPWLEIPRDKFTTPMPMKQPPVSRGRCGSTPGLPLRCARLNAGCRTARLPDFLAQSR